VIQLHIFTVILTALCCRYQRRYEIYLSQQRKRVFTNTQEWVMDLHLRKRRKVALTPKLHQHSVEEKQLIDRVGCNPLQLLITASAIRSNNSTVTSSSFSRFPGEDGELSANVGKKVTAIFE